RLFEDPADREQFLLCLEKRSSQDPAIVWTQGDEASLSNAEKEFSPVTPRAGQPPFVWKLKEDARPGKSIWNQKGQIYCLDFSSVLEMFPLNVVKKIADEEKWSDLRVVDVCAAPGGKSILAACWLKPNSQTSNEVDGSRAFTLKKNLERAGLSTIAVVQKSVEELAQDRTAEVVIVDAPCSGQSLIARGEKNLGAFHPASINGNANRQRRILAEASRMVTDKGFLIYSTCTYAFEENEKVIRWFLSKFPRFKTVEVPDLRSQRSELYPEVYCYRFFPHRGDGAGGFTTLLQSQ
ncbi:MAG: RsmB/NOP family class I SAM-dependent RNA methyltransferase, partial [Bdellovibrionales bacterium]|nr:RsmB/NOP family class I SAM-dependent RNA methyltransferase [Bdellovibrionales bacterium]